MATKRKTASVSRPNQPRDTDGRSDAVSLLKKDHQQVMDLFQQYQAAGSDEEKATIARQICKELDVHTRIEEEIFYPACRDKGVADMLMDQAQVEHDGAKVLIAELLTLPPDSAYYDAKVSVLREQIKHHVGEEEKPRGGIFSRAKAAGVDMDALGRQLQARKQELLLQEQTEGLHLPETRSLELRTDFANRQFKEIQMARQNYRERDEQGRFMSDDERSSRSRYSSRGDDDYGYGNGGRFRSNERERDEYGRFTSEDERGGGRYSSRGNERERDEYGRFMSEDERGGRYGRSERDEDYGYRGAGRERSGWFGDPEGHSESSRRGWEERGSSRFGGHERDDYGRFTSEDERGGGRYSSRGNERERDEYGRFVSEDERGSRYGRSGRDEDYRSRSAGRGQSGWFGDPEGHSEASRRGWEERGSSRSSRGRDEDEDDRRGSRGGDHRGWYGDSRGHAEAARRGWQHRG